MTHQLEQCEPKDRGLPRFPGPSLPPNGFVRGDEPNGNVLFQKTLTTRPKTLSIRTFNPNSLGSFRKIEDFGKTREGLESFRGPKGSVIGKERCQTPFCAAPPPPFALSTVERSTSS
jgi:hypothetical protein